MSTETEIKAFSGETVPVPVDLLVLIVDQLDKILTARESRLFRFALYAKMLAERGPEDPEVRAGSVSVQDRAVPGAVALLRA